MIIVILMVLIDQLSKIGVSMNQTTRIIIPKILNFTYVENRGMVFGLAQGSVYMVGVISLLVCIAFIVYMIQKKKKGEKIDFPLYMILAGGIGNLLDRILRGYVIDFIDTPWIATFNLADVFVVVGIILLFIKYCYLEKKSKEKAS